MIWKLRILLHCGLKPSWANHFSHYDIHTVQQSLIRLTPLYCHCNIVFVHVRSYLQPVLLLLCDPEHVPNTALPGHHRSAHVLVWKQAAQWNSCCKVSWDRQVFLIIACSFSMLLYVFAQVTCCRAYLKPVQSDILWCNHLWNVAYIYCTALT